MKAYKRILLKISGESLMGNKQFGLDNKTIKQIASEIKMFLIQKLNFVLLLEVEIFLEVFPLHLKELIDQLQIIWVC